MGIYIHHRVRLDGLVHEVALVLGTNDGVVTNCNVQRLFNDGEDFRDFIAGERVNCLWCVSERSR